MKGRRALRIPAAASIRRRRRSSASPVRPGGGRRPRQRQHRRVRARMPLPRKAVPSSEVRAARSAAGRRTPGAPSDGWGSPLRMDTDCRRDRSRGSRPRPPGSRTRAAARVDATGRDAAVSRLLEPTSAPTRRSGRETYGVPGQGGRDGTDSSRSPPRAARKGQLRTGT